MYESIAARLYFPIYDTPPVYTYVSMRTSTLYGGVKGLTLAEDVPRPFYEMLQIQ